jgi:hypothetical protein
MTCRKGLLHDAGRLRTSILARRLRSHFFKADCQLSITVKGTEALCAIGTPIRKRLPSAVTSPPIKPGGNWNRGLGTPA